MKTENINYIVFIKADNNGAITHKGTVKLTLKIASKVNYPKKAHLQVFRVAQATMKTGKVNLLHLSNL